MNRKSDLSDDNDLDINTTVDDDAFAELEQLAGQRVLYVHVWEDRVADAIERPSPYPAEVDIEDTDVDFVDSELAYEFDLDLYVEDGVYFELYSVLCYTDPETDPLSDAAAIQSRFRSLVQNGLWLDEVAVDEEDALVLIFSHDQSIVLYLVVGAWALDEWRELPDDADNT